MATINVRRGESVAWVCDIDEDLTGWTVDCELRASVDDSTLIDTLDTDIAVGTAGAFTISADPADTELWPLAQLVCDVRFTSPTADVMFSDVFYVRVTNSVTRT